MVKILVVDDSKFMRVMIKKMVEESGEYKVVAEAESDIEALDMYKAHRPDLVTMDIIMPDKSGLWALKEIMKFDPSAKIVMVSAMDRKDILEEALRAGAKGFIYKPIKTETLIKGIEDAINSNGVSG